MKRTKYSTKAFDGHKSDFKTISNQLLAESVRQYDHTRYGDGKDFRSEVNELLGEWHNRLD